MVEQDEIRVYGQQFLIAQGPSCANRRMQGVVTSVPFCYSRSQYLQQEEHYAMKSVMGVQMSQVREAGPRGVSMMEQEEDDLCLEAWGPVDKGRSEVIGVTPIQGSSR